MRLLREPSSGQVALGKLTSFTTAKGNIANTKRDWKLVGAGTLTLGVDQ